MYLYLFFFFFFGGMLSPLFFFFSFGVFFFLFLVVFVFVLFFVVLGGGGECSLHTRIDLTDRKSCTPCRQSPNNTKTLEFGAEKGLLQG